MSSGTTTSSDATESPVVPTENINQTEWFKIVLLLKKSVRFIFHTIGQNIHINYIDDCNEIFCAMTNQRKEFITASYEDTSAFLPSKTSPTFLDFCGDLMSMITPLHNAHTFAKSHPCTMVTIETQRATASLKRDILATYKNLEEIKTTNSPPSTN